MNTKELDGRERKISPVMDTRVHRIPADESQTKSSNTTVLVLHGHPNQARGVNASSQTYMSLYLSAYLSTISIIYIYVFLLSNECYSAELDSSLAGNCSVSTSFIMAADSELRHLPVCLSVCLSV